MKKALLEKNFFSSISSVCTIAMAKLPVMILDEFSYTIQFAKTAIVYCREIENMKSDTKTKAILDARYRGNQELMDSDLLACPLMIDRLNYLAENLPDESQTKEFATKHLPYVKRLYEYLKKYAKRES